MPRAPVARERELIPTFLEAPADERANIGYLAFSHGRMFLNVVNPRVGSYTKMDYAKSLSGDKDLIVKYGLDHFHRYSFNPDSKEIKFVNTNPNPYDLYERDFYKEAEKALENKAADEFVWVEFLSAKGDPRRTAVRRWKHGLILASVEGLDDDHAEQETSGTQM